MKTSTLIIFNLVASFIGFTQTSDEYFNLGIKSLSTGDSIEATIIYSLDPEIKPEFEFGYRGIGKLNLPAHKSAIVSFNKAIELNTNFENAYFYRALAKASLSDYIEAILDLNKTIEINPNNTSAYCERGGIKRLLGDNLGALMDYSKAIKIDPKFERAYLEKGAIKHNNKNDYLGAIAEYSKAIEVDSKYALAYYNRAFSKLKLKQISNACLDFSKAGELGYFMAYDAIKVYCK